MHTQILTVMKKKNTLSFIMARDHLSQLNAQHQLNKKRRIRLKLKFYSAKTNIKSIFEGIV
jgi:hypothetical protein